MAELPDAVIERAEHLTRRARELRDGEAASEARAERDTVLAEYGYRARVREDEDRAVLVCHPQEWLEDGTAALDSIEDTDRAIERPLSGPTGADWEQVLTDNDAVVEQVRAEHGEDHASNARALAEYAQNHHATTIDRLTDDQLAHFREEYYPRNVWPTEAQATLLADSLEKVKRIVKPPSDSTPE